MTISEAIKNLIVAIKGSGNAEDIDEQAIATLANANKTAINAIIANLKAAGVMA